MKVQQTPLQDCFIIQDTVFTDDRGYFFESFNQQTFAKLTGLDVHFVQDNQSKSSKGVLRGLHFQKGEHAQAKLVRVLQGRVLDVAVDIRKGSPTYGKVFTLELSAESKKQLLIPKGFAHGYSVLSQTAEVFYKCDEFYHKECEGGIMYNDAALNINWQIPADKAIISEKDKRHPGLNNCINNFSF